MRDWWPFLTRCLWRGHRIRPVTYHFTGFADPSPLTFDECEVCGYLERSALPVVEDAADPSTTPVVASSQREAKT